MQAISANGRMLVASVLCRTWILRGRLKDCEHDVTLLYGGHKEHLSYIRRLLFGAQSDARYLGRRAIWSLPAVSRRLGAELALIPGCESLRRFHPGDAGFFIPWWVTGEISTALDYSKPPWKRQLSGDLRRLKKIQYGHVVSRSPRDVQLFYESMYLPLIERSHGDGALPADLDEMLSHIRAGGELIFTLEGDEFVAGELLIYMRDLAISRAIGVKDADPALIKRSVMAASTLSAIQHARDKGFSRLHLGGSRPFLTDGVLQYKKKWGLKLVGHDRYGHFLRVMELSSGVRSLLERMPFIYVRNGQLWGAVFEDADHPEPPVPTRARPIGVAGLSGITIHKMRSSIKAMEPPVEVVA